MSNENTDFLRFSAYSIKEYIKRKLSENPKFTDQIYEGSNLNILIDLVSYMYQCMMYQLNNAAAESMWSDTQIYENISRLSKILGYSPRGIIPSTCSFYLDNTDSSGESGYFKDEKGNDYTIPKYSYINTGKTDSKGKTIYFSTYENVKVSRDRKTFELKMKNGQWKLYSTIFTATGDDYETFILEGLGSDQDNGNLVGHNCIDLYVYRNNQIDSGWTSVEDEIFTNNKLDFTNDNYYGKIYSKADKVYNLRLNENKIYEIKFGNGVIGKKLEKGDLLYIFYLDTNGDEGYIDSDTISINGTRLKHSPNDFGISNKLYNKIFYSDADKDVNQYVSNKSPSLFVTQILPSSLPTREEDVDDIRNNAPLWFKNGKRLVTEEDYRNYILNLLNDSNIIDCVVQNVWAYTSTFYAWLYKIGLQYHDNEAYYLNQNKLVKYDYKYSDAADANNIYIWTKLYNQKLDTVSDIVTKKMANMKLMTSNIVLLDPIVVNFAITAAPHDRVLEYLENDTSFDELGESYIEVTLDNDILYVASEVKDMIETKILNFFDQTKMKIGQTINYNELLQDIFNINGISRIRTVWQKKIDKDTNDTSTPCIVREGICFATWAQTMIEPADSLDISNNSKTLEKFQFPNLYDQTISNKIKIIKKTISNINKITY